MYYRYNSQYGVVEITIPDKLDENDITDLRDYLNLILKRLERSTKEQVKKE